MTKRFPCRTDDFCLIHGSERMVSELGNPIPFCEACEAERGDSAVVADSPELKSLKTA